MIANVADQVSSEVTLSDIFNELLRLRSEVAALREGPAVSTAPRKFYTVNETATMLGRSAYTVRQWANEGRINAVKRVERRGGSAAWNISADEIERYRNEGFLTADPRRNDRN